MSEEIEREDAVGMARLVATGQVTSVELVEAAISRIERVNGRVNAVVTKIYEQAREGALNPLPGPFSGVPILLKELLPYPGLPSTMASAAFAEAPTAPIPVILERIAAAGFVVIGRTNSSEFGALPTTQPDLFGPTRNPWNLAHDSGGSSGGSAAAVASGMVPLAQGGDAGGSIRIPASACGVFGLKVSRGRISSAPGVNVDGFGTHHALTRTVRDSAAFLDVVKGASQGERWPAPPDEAAFASQIDRPPPILKIAVALNGFMGHADAHPDCAEAVDITAQLCAYLGHDVELTQPEIDHSAANNAFLEIAAIGAARMLAELRGRQADVPHRKLGKWMWGMAELGGKLPSWAAARGIEVLQRAAYTIAEFQQRYDIILTPVLHRPPVRIGEIIDDYEFPELREKMLEYCPHTQIVNATGQPAMSVPLHWSPTGLPIGTHFIARWGEEALLFKLARQLELARPWAQRIPPTDSRSST